MTGKPRGIRNRNPGNIEYNGIQWDGLAAYTSDTRFCVFETMEYGVRALAKVLLTYQRKHGLSTVRQMIERWAPPSENDTESYVWHVAGVVGVTPDEPMDLASEGFLFRLARAIVDHENGFDPDGKPWVSDATIRAGLLLI